MTPPVRRSLKIALGVFTYETLKSLTCLFAAVIVFCGAGESAAGEIVPIHRISFGPAAEYADILYGGMAVWDTQAALRSTVKYTLAPPGR